MLLSDLTLNLPGVKVPGQILMTSMFIITCFMRLAKAAVFLTFLYSVHMLHAQEAWSLQDCIEYAWANNLSVRQQSIEVSRKINDIRKRKLEFLPEIDASLGHNLNWGRSVDLQNLEIIRNRLSQSTSASVNASVCILDGLSRFYNLKISRKSLEISEQETERIKDDISVSIVRSYLQILLSEEMLSIAEESLQSVEKQKERTITLVEAGRQPYSALLEIESQLASERVLTVTARNQLKADLLTLQQLLDLPYSNCFSIEIPDTEKQTVHFPSEDIGRIYSIAVSMPAIQGARLAVSRSELELKAAKGRFYPKISISAGYGTFYSSSTMDPEGNIYPFQAQFRDNINPSVSIGLTVPIFSRGDVYAGIRDAELTKQSLETELAIKQQNLFKEIQAAVIEAENCFSKMEAALANVKSMEESFRYVEAKFNAGNLDGTDYTVSKTSLFKARSEYLQAKYRFLFQMKIIDFYKGLPLAI